MKRFKYYFKVTNVPIDIYTRVHFMRKSRTVNLVNELLSYIKTLILLSHDLDDLFRNLTSVFINIMFNNNLLYSCTTSLLTNGNTYCL